MILIFGGAWQGKLDFARARFGLNDDDICLCTAETDAIDFDRRCLAYVDRFALNRVRLGEETLDAFARNADRLTSLIVIATDISCGVVPVDPVMRAWRETCGRMNNWLAARSEEVWRLFCGLPQRLK